MACFALFFSATVCFGKVNVTMLESAKFVFRVSWDANSEDDLAGYTVYCGFCSRCYVDSIRIVDNLCTIFIPDSLHMDSIFVAVAAFDTAGNRSDYSEELSFIPAALAVDRNKDGLISLKDYQDFFAEYKKYKNRYSYRRGGVTPPLQ